MLTHFARAVLFSIFRSKGQLLSEINNYFGDDTWNFTPQFSGRVAIRKIATLVSSKRPDSCALVPRYLCNVVPMALEAGGQRLVFYDTNDSFMPNLESILDLMAKKNVGLVVICPLYGSDGGASFLVHKRFREALASSGALLLIDACQNIEYMKRLVGSGVTGYERVVFVCSFNDKNIPGLMGGGIVARSDIFDANQPEIGQLPTFSIFWYGLKKYALGQLKQVLAKKRRSRSAEQVKKFELTTGKTFPYQLVHYQPTKLQLAMAVLGLRKLPLYRQRQASFLNSQKNSYRDLPEAATSSHVVWIAHQAPQGAQSKQPYALHNDLERSERPELVIIGNSGY